MAKDRSFASKVAKTGQGAAQQRVCLQCNQVVTMYKVIDSFKSEKNSAWRFKEKMVPVCKCNEQQVVG
ncbi:hypothetical protein GF406_06775 [candidate division KSB1 bacterium]|nr:hypothetical protein [candidate division KSB1 bacterium]